MPSLLARFAENNFWLARYMERAENLARILDVNETFAQDGRGPQDWLPIVYLHDDTERFFASHLPWPSVHPRYIVRTLGEPFDGAPLERCP